MKLKELKELFAEAPDDDVDVFVYFNAQGMPKMDILSVHPRASYSPTFGMVNGVKHIVECVVIKIE